jgi:cellulose biosynthesis protein BcsQ
VANFYDPRSRVGAEVLKKVEKKYPNALFSARMPRRRKLAESHMVGQPLREMAPIEAFMFFSLAGEIAQKIL